MRTFQVFVVAVVFGMRCAIAATHSFPEHRFAVEVPDSWQEITPRPQQMATAMQSSDLARRFIVLVVPLDEAERATGAAELHSGTQKSLIEQGWTVEPQESITIDGIPFLGFSGHGPGKVNLTAYTATVGDKAYMLQSILVGAPSLLDPELSSVVRSFHFLASTAQAPGAGAAVAPAPASAPVPASIVTPAMPDPRSSRNLWLNIIGLVLLAIGCALGLLRLMGRPKSAEPPPSDRN